MKRVIKLIVIDVILSVIMPVAKSVKVTSDVAPSKKTLPGSSFFHLIREDDRKNIELLILENVSIQVHILE